MRAPHASENRDRKGGLGPLLRERNYRILLASSAISRFGDSVDIVAYGWMVYKLTGSTLLMGSIFAVSGLPNLLFGFLAGVLVDHWPKRPLVVLCHALRAFLVGAVALLFGTGRLETWMLFAFALLNSTIESFAHPAAASLTQRVIPKERLLAARSLSQSVQSAAELAGMGLAGFIIASLGVAGAIAVDAATFAVAALGAFLLEVEGDLGRAKVDAAGAADSAGKASGAAGARGAAAAAGPLRAFLRELGEGFRFIASDSLIRITVGMAVFVNFALAPFNALQAAYVGEVLGAGPEGISALGIGFTLGMILGGLLLASFGGRFGRWRIVMSGFLLVGLLSAALALPALLPAGAARLLFATAAMFLTGASLPLINSTMGAYLLERTPQGLSGRVTAVLGVTATAAMPMGSAAAGALAEIVSLPVLYAALGILMLLVAGFAASRPAVLAELRRRGPSAADSPSADSPSADSPSADSPSANSPAAVPNAEPEAAPPARESASA